MMWVLILTITAVITTMTYGVVNYLRGQECSKNKLKSILKINIASFLPIVCAAVIILVPDIAHAATSGEINSSAGLGYIAAALSTGIAAIGAGYAVAITGSAALGAISEDSKLLSKTLIFVGLAEGIAIYGLIVSIMILSKL